MIEDSDSLYIAGLPAFLDRSEELLSCLKSKEYAELKKIWQCNDDIATLNYERLRRMDLKGNLSPAIIAYDGIAFKYMAPGVFEDKHFTYIEKNLRILSAFYGVLRPMDGVTPYRLEMGAKLKVGEYKDLYDFWGDLIYKEVRDDSGVIVNLASDEYSKCVKKHLKENDKFLNIVFGEYDNNKFKTKGTYAKMARGEMVRFMAERNIEDVKEIKKFNDLGYIFREDLSDELNYVFERRKER